MRRFGNILYVSEPDIEDAPAIERATTLAENNQARLTMLHVEREPRLGPFAARHTREEARELLRQREVARLDTLAAASRGRVAVDTIVRFGIPFIEIIREVLENGRDLVIKSAAGHGERVFSSTDMHLLRKCPSALWIMHANDKSNYERIIAAVDFDPYEADRTEEVLNHSILELAGSLALSDFAELHLVHAWSGPVESLIRLWSDDTAEQSIMSYLETERQLHDRGVNRLAGALRDEIGMQVYDYLDPDLHLVEGEAEEVIPALVSELQADLVVMGTVARTGIPGFFIGNTAENVLHRIDCSILALKPEGFVSPVTVDD